MFNTRLTSPPTTDAFGAGLITAVALSNTLPDAGISGNQPIGGRSALFVLQGFYETPLGLREVSVSRFLAESCVTPGDRRFKVIPQEFFPEPLSSCAG